MDSGRLQIMWHLKVLLFASSDVLHGRLSAFLPAGRAADPRSRLRRFYKFRYRYMAVLTDQFQLT